MIAERTGREGFLIFESDLGGRMRGALGGTNEAQGVDNKYLPGFGAPTGGPSAEASPFSDIAGIFEIKKADASKPQVGPTWPQVGPTPP